MKEQLISFETAKLAKEKGFDVPVEHHFVEGYVGQFHSGDKSSHDYNKEDKRYSAPTQALLQKWLREKLNLHVWCIPNNSPEICDGYNPVVQGRVEYGRFMSYEEALEFGLQKALKLLK